MDLQTALQAAACTEIWVARGLYKPTSTGDRDVAFSLRAGTGVYGGFLGSETAREQRNGQANRTVLSGDIDNNDVRDADGVLATTAGIVGSNSTQVVRLQSVPSTTVLDGFTVTGGDANGSRPNGGGLYCDAFVGGVCNPTLVNLVFSGNRAVSGGAMGLGDGSSPTLRNILFTGNAADLGGALYVAAAGGLCAPSLRSVVFRNNSASTHGGAIVIRANALLDMRGGAFVDNTAVLEGGAIYILGSGSDGVDGYVDLAIANTTFHANRSTTSDAQTGKGGAVSATGSRGLDVGVVGLSFDNVTITDNSAAGSGKAVYVGTLSPSGTVEQRYRNVVIWGNGGGASGSVIETSITTWSINRAIYQVPCPACTNTVNADPLLGAIGDNGGGIPTRVPAASSPAVDSGDNAVCALPAVNNVDARGVTRPQGPQCDLGAVEREVSAPVIDPIFANGFQSPPPG